ncbi:MAG TPA: glutamine--fructose-6-phosphate transaminase (isomerizing) [Nitrospirota bacterium]|nr:glutamine--fructose-6-phosphate transaminase (isomerizing) [Nitrospirota bacterium]
MSGIVGYIGKKDSLQILVDGLTRLEYRGYDSSGIAFKNGLGIEVYKTPGKLKDLQKLLPTPLPAITIGIGHTRWATHGAPSAVNAHPHTVKGVSVVHNGIIENYRELRNELVALGQVFTSQTDTEVVPQLIARYLESGLPIDEAIRRAITHLLGAYALGIMYEGTPDRLFAIRNGRPLAIGIGTDAQYITSDVSALLPYTKNFIYLEDRHMAVLRSSGVDLRNIESLESLPLEGKIVTVNWTPAIAEKQGYDHFMLKEIYEQPQGVMDTLGEWIDDTNRLMDEMGIAESIKDLRRLHIAACGTSYHAGLVGRYMIEKFVRIPVAVDIASEFRDMSPVIPKGTVLITITQSGETADTLAAQREAKEKGARTLTICNVVGSTTTREADSVLYTRAGLEIGVVSTKAFTAQLAALSLLGIALGTKKGKLSDVEIQTLKPFFLDLPRLIRQTLQTDEVVKEIAKTLVDVKSMLYVGRGINYPVALEGALKMKEIAYIHADGYAAGEIKHGPIALLEEGVPVIFLATIDGFHEKSLSNIEEVKALGGKVIVVTDSPAAFRGKADDIIVVPSTHPALVPFVTVVPLQLLAYYVAVLKGCNVDQPRNLSKSVTVDNDKCHNIGCSYSGFCRRSIKCAEITPDEKKRIANIVVRLMHVSSWEQFSTSSLLESSGLLLQKTVHQEQASKGLSTCFVSPY